MRVAAGAIDLGTHHAVRDIALGTDMRGVDGCVETWPTSARIKLVLAGEQRQTAHHTGVRALLLVVEQIAAERRFGAGRLGDPIRLRIKFRGQLLDYRRCERRDVIARLALRRRCGLGGHGSRARFRRGTRKKRGAPKSGKKGDDGRNKSHWECHDGKRRRRQRHRVAFRVDQCYPSPSWRQFPTS